MIEGMTGRSPTARHPPPAARRFTRTSLAITEMHTAILAGRAPHHVTRRGSGPAHFPSHLALRLRPRLSLLWLCPAFQFRP